MSLTDKKKYGTGHSDKLTPVYPIDVAKHSTVSDLLHEYAHTAFGGRSLGEAADTMEKMFKDPDCLVVMTLSGAMTVAKQGLLVCEMIERGWVNVVVSTGALMAHGLVEGSGRTHFKYDPRMNDEQLAAKGYDRVYDTLELEQNLDDVDLIIREVIETSIPEGETLHSASIFKAVGKYLNDTLPKDTRAILKSAYKMSVPVFVPAFTDSELGLDVALMNQIRLRDGKPRRSFDPFFDLEAYAALVGIQRKAGIFTIGGGVPRNWAQQLGPFLDIIEKRTGGVGRGFRFHYGVRVCPEPVHWGGLSGCTYSEGVSWGKFVPKSEGGQFSEVLTDATIAWPLLVRGLIERLGDKTIKKDLPRPDPMQKILLKNLGGKKAKKSG
jgi:deoxyhypusine synthase